MRPNDSTAFVQAGRPFAGDTIVRLYSMSKPLVSAAAMVLYERGDFQFDEHVSKRLPSFADQRVYVSGGGEDGAEMVCRVLSDKYQNRAIVTRAHVIGDRASSARGDL